MSYQQLSLVARTARKSHRCIWCGEAIVQGEKYLDRRGINDGEPNTDPFHINCHEAQCAFFRANSEDEFDPYSFRRGTTEGKT